MKRAGIACAVLMLWAATASAQEISNTLSGSTAAQGFSVYAKGGILNLFTARGNGHVGIGTATPAFKLTLSGDGGILADGTHGSGQTLSVSGIGTRLIWYPRKSAFRAGAADLTSWDDLYIGNYSAAFGIYTIASGSSALAAGNNCEATGEAATAFGWRAEAGGKYATAIGRDCEASGDYAVALGGGTTASGNWSVALGANTKATAMSSVAMGDATQATSPYCFAMGEGVLASAGHSVAMGHQSTASGSVSVALGQSATASASYAIAIGRYCTAGGSSSVALGSFASTGTRDGAFVLGDASGTTTMTATSNNRLYARFDNGYYLYTRADRSLGVRAIGGANSWSSISDSTRKEEYRAANLETVLSAFRSLRLGTWNYIGDNQRHYGPMAQEWYAAFGRDGVGTIGDDTTLATADVDGVLCIAIKALEQRTAELHSAVAQLNSTVTALRVADEEIVQLRAALISMEKKLDVAEENSARIDALTAFLEARQLDMQPSAGTDEGGSLSRK